MQRYRMALAAGDRAETFDLLCADDEEALLVCLHQVAASRCAEAWQGNRLICRWEVPAGRRGRS